MNSCSGSLEATLTINVFCHQDQCGGLSCINISSAFFFFQHCGNMFGQVGEIESQRYLIWNHGTSAVICCGGIAHKSRTFAHCEFCSVTLSLPIVVTCEGAWEEQMESNRERYDWPTRGGKEVREMGTRCCIRGREREQCSSSCKNCLLESAF